MCRRARPIVPMYRSLQRTRPQKNPSRREVQSLKQTPIVSHATRSGNITRVTQSGRRPASPTSRGRKYECTDGPLQLIRTQTILTDAHYSLTCQNQNMPRMSTTGEKVPVTQSGGRSGSPKSKDHQHKSTDSSHQLARTQTLLTDAWISHIVRD